VLLLFTDVADLSIKIQPALKNMFQTYFFIIEASNKIFSHLKKQAVNIVFNPNLAFLDVFFAKLLNFFVT